MLRVRNDDVERRRKTKTSTHESTACFVIQAQCPPRAEGRLFKGELDTPMVHIFAPKLHPGTVPVGADLGVHGVCVEKGGKSKSKFNVRCMVLICDAYIYVA